MATRGGGGTKPRDLVVRFLSDVAGFVKGTDAVADALDDTARKMDETAREADTASDKIARDYDAAAEKMERSTDEFTRDLAASYRAAARRVRAENDKISRDTTDTFRDTGREAGTELAQNMGESIATNDWSRLANDTAGGLSSALLTQGPVGIITGAGVALGGIFLAGFQARTARIKEAAAATFTAFRDGILEQAEKEDLLTQLLGAETYDEALRKLGQLARAAGEDASTVADALLEGGSEAQQLGRRLGEVQDKVLAVRGGVVSSEQVTAARDLARFLDEAAASRADAAEAARVERDLTRETAGVLARTYRGSAYAPGGSTYQSQVPYSRGGRG